MLNPNPPKPTSILIIMQCTALNTSDFIFLQIGTMNRLHLYDAIPKRVP